MDARSKVLAYDAMAAHVTMLDAELDAMRDRVGELETENERLRLHEQTVLAFVERAERGGEPLDTAKIRRALDAVPARKD